jgi:hypothetical protein
METTDLQDIEKFQSATDMISKVFVKCLEFVGAAEVENR